MIIREIIKFKSLSMKHDEKKHMKLPDLLKLILVRKRFYFCSCIFSFS